MRHFKPHKIPEESYNPKRERGINSKLNCLKTSRHGTVISRIGGERKTLGQLLQRAIVVQIYDRLVQFKGTMIEIDRYKFGRIAIINCLTY